MLTEHGMKIAPSTYYDQSSRRPSKRALRDEQLVALMLAARAKQKLVCRFGARKMWLHLRSQGHDVARCTIERLYRQQGWRGAVRGRTRRTTTADDSHARPADLVDRDFTAAAPNQLWVADFKCRRRHLKSYADLRTMPTLAVLTRANAVLGADWSA